MSRGSLYLGSADERAPRGRHAREPGTVLDFSREEDDESRSRIPSENAKFVIGSQFVPIALSDAARAR